MSREREAARASDLFRTIVVKNAYVCAWIAECDEDAYRLLSRVSAPFARFFVLGAAGAGWRRELRARFTHIVPHSSWTKWIEYRLGRRLLLHRDDGPAVEYADGSEEWWRYGKLHRGGDLPAVVHVNIVTKWCVDGKHHRDNDQPACVYADGHKSWWYNGVRYRTSSPSGITWPQTIPPRRISLHCSCRLPTLFVHLVCWAVLTMLFRSAFLAVLRLQSERESITPAEV